MKTEITDLSKFSRCLIRKRWVVATPEERVRQKLIHTMMADLGFPKGLISIEKKIGSRRFDLVCYTREMMPLLLVECKAGELDEAAERQAFGYNERVGAPFICLANGTGVKTFWHEGERLVCVPFLPKYVELDDVFRRK